jgi:hypothetical protein
MASESQKREDADKARRMHADALLKLIDTRTLDLCHPDEGEETVIEFGGVPFCTQGNFSIVAGPPKAGKSFLLSICAAAWIIPGQRLVGNIMAMPPAGMGRVVYIDTEQGRRHAKKVFRTIAQLAGGDGLSNPDNITYLQLRGCEPKEIAGVVDAIFERFGDVGLVVIDGFKDLLADPMGDAVEAKGMFTRLMALTQRTGCHIITATHTNKTAPDVIGGHSGSIGAQKAEGWAIVTDTDGVKRVEARECREMPFESFAFSIDENRMPQPCELPDAGAGAGGRPRRVTNHERAASMDRQEHARVLGNVFATSAGDGYTQRQMRDKLRSYYAQYGHPGSDDFARVALSYLERWGMVVKEVKSSGHHYTLGKV